MISSDDLSNITNQIVEQYQPRCIYLFGSQVHGNTNDESDLDLLVIDDDQNFEASKAAAINLSLYPRDFHLDLLYYSQTQFQEKLEKRLSFFIDITKNGKKLYERA